MSRTGNDTDNYKSDRAAGEGEGKRPRATKMISDWTERFVINCKRGHYVEGGREWEDARKQDRLRFQIHGMSKRSVQSSLSGKICEGYADNRPNSQRG